MVTLKLLGTLSDVLGRRERSHQLYRPGNQIAKKGLPVRSPDPPLQRPPSATTRPPMLSPLPPFLSTCRYSLQLVRQFVLCLFSISNLYRTNTRKSSFHSRLDIAEACYSLRRGCQRPPYAQDCQDTGEHITVLENQHAGKTKPHRIGYGSMRLAYADVLISNDRHMLQTQGNISRFLEINQLVLGDIANEIALNISPRTVPSSFERSGYQKAPGCQHAINPVASTHATSIYNGQFNIRNRRQKIGKR
jgi:hypothetical protein